MRTNLVGFCGAFTLLVALVGLAKADELVTLVQPPDDENVFVESSEYEPGGNDWFDERAPHFIFSVDNLFLHAVAFTGGRITMSFDDSTTVGTDISFVTGDGYSGYTNAPRMTFGRQFGEKWGVVGRCFNLNAVSNLFPDLTPGTTPLPTFGTFFEISSVKLETIDVEAVRSFHDGPNKLDLSFGARYASLDVDAQTHAFGVITTGHFVNLLLANGCAFDGAGVTGGATLRRTLGDGPVSVFIGGRGSQLWGETNSYGRVAGASLHNPDPPHSGAATVSRSVPNGEMHIWEAQLGAQFDFELRIVRANAFVRIAAEYQHWDIQGPPTGGAGYGATDGTLTTASFASANLGDTHLFGATVATGITW